MREVPAPRSHYGASALACTTSASPPPGAARAPAATRTCMCFRISGSSAALRSSGDTHWVTSTRYASAATRTCRAAPGVGGGSGCSTASATAGNTQAGTPRACLPERVSVLVTGSWHGPSGCCAVGAMRAAHLRLLVIQQLPQLLKQVPFRALLAKRPAQCRELLRRCNAHLRRRANVHGASPQPRCLLLLVRTTSHTSLRWGQRRYTCKRHASRYRHGNSPTLTW